VKLRAKNSIYRGEMFHCIKTCSDSFEGFYDLLCLVLLPAMACVHGSSSGNRHVPRVNSSMHSLKGGFDS